MVSAVAGSLYSQIDKALSLITPPNVTNPIEFWLAFAINYWGSSRHYDNSNHHV
ncbi:MAG: hypothetical protein BJBARM4_0995 [Candidatus Parvarchaeum acidiphilum ARMAN-4]|uniref:Uncharacterized protein n=1 Tax=Candidatus Parvarchaeum acidiphilum ARMAN-4 TaxID=662760 RepID=D2EGT7_PARA4|nr:MAG: hypothetical protein BJBARM4_0995 [Candidatus Parvarchaeum acidiphilum ARMAN-4]